MKPLYLLVASALPSVVFADVYDCTMNTSMACIGFSEENCGYGSRFRVTYDKLDNPTFEVEISNGTLVTINSDVVHATSGNDARSVAVLGGRGTAYMLTIFNDLSAVYVSPSILGDEKSFVWEEGFCEHSE